MSATDYWQEHQVGGPYATLEESNAALDERLTLYPNLYDLMPVSFPGKTVLDYGCGPGHDTVLFRTHEAQHVTFADVSLQAMATTARRLTLHGIRSRTHGVMIGGELPKVDHVHCAGVLHHMTEPLNALASFRRSLARDGTCRVMIYDGDRSEHTQSDVPVTHWWGEEEFTELAYAAGFNATYLGGYECSAPWRPNCYAACYTLC